MLTPKAQLTESERQSAMSPVVKDGIASITMTNLSSGPFLAAFALLLGASNTLLGLLAAIPPLGHLMQIPAIYLVERVRNRRVICLVASAINRSCWLVIALMPFWVPQSKRLLVLTVLLVVNSMFSAVSNCSWNSWMRDIIPQSKLGHFFSRRLMLASSLSMVLSLAAGVFLDHRQQWVPGQPLMAYSVIFLVVFLLGVISTYYIARIPEPMMEASAVSFKGLLARPFQDDNFRQLTIFLGAWNFAINLAAPFFTVYMLHQLELPMGMVIQLTVISQLFNIWFIKLWGRVVDQWSSKSVLMVSGPLFMFATLAWTFTTLPGKYLLTVPLLFAIHAVMGIALAGVTLASGTITIKLAPKGLATSYIATVTLVNSIAAGIAPILGGLAIDSIATWELAWTWTWRTATHAWSITTFDLRQWDFFFVGAFIIGLYALHRLAAVREVGEVKEQIVIEELIAETRRGMRSLSTVYGIRQMVRFPIWLAGVARGGGNGLGLQEDSEKKDDE